MARREPIEITLGELKFQVRALTIDQMQAIEAAMKASHGHQEVFPVAVKVLAIALGRDHAGKVAELGQIECEPAEVALAMQAVLRHGGFLKGVPTPGEAARGSTGDRSVDASPPASA